MDEFQNPMTLKEAFGVLYENLSSKRKILPILVDSDAFKQADPDAPDLNDTLVKFPPYPKQMRVAEVLRIALAKVPTGNATYLVCRGTLVITTQKEASPEFLLKQKVFAIFDKRPLTEAMQELSDQTGASIVLDCRAAEQAKIPLSAIFRGDTTLESALTILTDMVELKLVVLPGGLYVTSPDRAQTLDREQRLKNAQTKLRERPAM